MGTGFCCTPVVVFFVSPHKPQARTEEDNGNVRTIEKPTEEACKTAQWKHISTKTIKEKRKPIEAHIDEDGKESVHNRNSTLLHSQQDNKIQQLQQSNSQNCVTINKMVHEIPLWHFRHRACRTKFERNERDNKNFVQCFIASII